MDVQGLASMETTPSSPEPCALADSAFLSGHSNGTRTTSRPPSSRAASTTISYWPGDSVVTACESSRFSACSPAPRVAPVMPSTAGVSCPLLRHQLRMSLSHLAPPLLRFLTSYQSATLPAKDWSDAFSIQAATYGLWYSARFLRGSCTFNVSSADRAGTAATAAVRANE